MHISTDTGLRAITTAAKKSFMKYLISNKKIDLNSFPEKDRNTINEKEINNYCCPVKPDNNLKK